MKKIISITNVFIKEYYQNLPIFDSSQKKLNKKSLFFWLLLFIFLGVSYLSYETINFLKEIGQKELFINMYFPLLAILLAFQSVLSSANIFFFSKDIEKVLYMPIKPIELLISKMSTMLCMLYATEVVITIVPLTLYGLLTNVNLLYYFWVILIIGVFPIFISTVVNILTFVIMKFSKFIKNKEIFQVLISLVLIAVIFVVEFMVTKNIFEISSEGESANNIISFNEKIKNVNELFLIVNPIEDILIKPTGASAVMQFIKVICCSIAVIFLFSLIGNVTYLKCILKNTVSLGKVNKKRNIQIKNHIQSRGIAVAYVCKEIKLLIRQPAFFMQCVFPVMILLVSSIIIVVSIWPAILKAMQDDEINKIISNFKFNSEVACDILIILQVMFSISNISLTAISRDGNSARFVKYIPVDLYKQFIYKNIPQFLLNVLISIVVLVLIGYILPSISIKFLLMIFAISLFINLLNCYIMLIVDLRRPNLDWSSEQAVVKKSDNKIFQYAFLIINVVLLFYLANIFKEVNIMIAMFTELMIYFVLFIILDRCVSKWKKELFDKIE